MASPTRGAAIVFQLTHEILSGTLAPGETLEETALAARLGASRTPVREALRQLAASGLVELRAHRPARVMPVDEARITDMFEVMAELEALCAARAARMMPPGGRRALEAHHVWMAGLVRAGDLDGYRAANVAFHALIYDGARNGYLSEIALATRERLAPHRGVQLDSPERLARSHAEHDTVVVAILRGDAAGAAEAMRAHLAETRAAVGRIGARQELPVY
ncbi:MAG: GntR family transcriptional regulator [Salinarimonas sp.]